MTDNLQGPKRKNDASFQGEVESTSAGLRALAGDPARCALLVIDVQKVFCDANPSDAQVYGTRETESCAQAIASIAPVFREAGAQIYAIHHEQDGLQLDFHHFEPDRTRDICVAKDTMSAFRSSNIKKLLNENGQDYLLACGFYLSACVQNTAIDAKKHNYHATLLADLTDTLFANNYRKFFHNGVSVTQSRALTNWPT